MKKVDKKTNLEEKIKDLNSMLDELKKNEINLEESVEIYRNAMLLYSQCITEMEALKLEIKTIDGLSINI